MSCFPSLFTKQSCEKLSQVFSNFSISPLGIFQACSNIRRLPFMKGGRLRTLLNRCDTTLQSRDMFQQSIEASFNVNILVMNNKSLALNKPYENVVSIRYELWKIHVGLAFYAREDPPSLNATNRDGFKRDGLQKHRIFYTACLNVSRA